MPVTKKQIKDILDVDIQRIEEMQNYLLDEWSGFIKKDKDKAGNLISKLQTTKEDLIGLYKELEKND